MFEELVESITEAFETLAEALEDLLEGFADVAETFGLQRQVYEFSTKGYGEAANLPERKTSSIIEFHSAPLSQS